MKKKAPKRSLVKTAKRAPKKKAGRKLTDPTRKSTRKKAGRASTQRKKKGGGRKRPNSPGGQPRRQRINTTIRNRSRTEQKACEHKWIHLMDRYIEKGWKYQCTNCGMKAR